MQPPLLCFLLSQPPLPHSVDIICQWLPAQEVLHGAALGPAALLGMLELGCPRVVIKLVTELA